MTSPADMFRKQIEANILSHGQMVINIFPGSDADAPDFCWSYTIGNWRLKLPELVMFGGDNSTMHWALNETGRRMRTANAPFADGVDVDLGGKHPVRIINATHPETRSKWTIQAGQFWRDETYLVQQVLIPDELGRFPGNSECGKPYCHVPFLKAN